MSGQNQQQQNPTPQHPERDANNPAGYVLFLDKSCTLFYCPWFDTSSFWTFDLYASLLAIAEETLAEFLAKATGTAVDWVQMIGMKVNPLEQLFI